MLTCVYGIKNLDEEFDNMIKIKLDCEKKGIKYPEHLYEYFFNPCKSIKYLREQIEFVSIKEAICIKNKDKVDGWQVDLSKLPKNVKAIRFENLY